VVQEELNMPERKKIGVLISGRGSNMISIAKACRSGDINGDITVVISNKKNAPGLEKAASMGIETLFISHKAFSSREEFDSAMVGELRGRSVDLVCLAGFMRLLSPVMVRAFRNRIMNIHPSLLPAFPGLNAQWQAVDYGVKVSGATVHFVDEDLDHGPIIIQQAVTVRDDDTGDSLAERILKIEHEIYPASVRLFCRDRLTVTGRRVTIE
jgi:phosphoribosylglycinamide formyltransferase-1